jgi:Zn-dependent M16 (insulinase) family peptidase
MNNSQDPRNPGLEIGRRLEGYRIRRMVQLPEIEAIFYELQHEDTGARHIHISRNDRENTFGVMLKTVPTDSTGVAHILEHTVLCGSAKYPVRDPFFSMLKRSLSTFMNAFTASDWTLYPFCTQNAKDFANLMDIYLDAVFFPRLERLSFRQEGHRLELEGHSLSYKGVVYNEMKGAMSSPDQVLVRSLMNHLYPDTTYRHNSGGDPSVIPKLTHEQLVAFHRRHYHPSNAFFYTYGDMPLKGHLARIASTVMRQFEGAEPPITVPAQARWQSSRQATVAYPLSPEENPERKSQVCLAWLVSDIRDTYETLVMSLLEQVLLGNAGSPLRKALIESGIGSALSDGTGFDADNRDTMFVCGLKGVAPEDADRIEALIFDCLSRLVREGIDPQLVASAIHQVEFSRKEVTNTPYPYGLRVLLIMSSSWLHGGDPVQVLNFDDNLARLKQALGEGDFFEKRIRMHFLDNPHRVRLLLVPDQRMASRQQADVEAELDAVQRGLSEAAIAQIKSDSQALRAQQEVTEDVSVLPTLALSDVPPEVNRVSPSAQYDARAAACYRQPTSGIAYFSAAAAVDAVDPEDLMLIPFLCHILPRIGTLDRDYTALSRHIDAVTGGMGLSANARMGFENGTPGLPFVAFNAKCLSRNIDPMFSLISEVATRFSFDDHARLKQLILEYRSAMESVVVQNGHRLALSLAARAFSPVSALSEQWHGISQLKMFKALEGDLSEAALKTIADRLQNLARTVLRPDNLSVALVGSDSDIRRGTALLAPGEALGQLAGADVALAMPAVETEAQLPREGWSTSTAVSFVASAFQTVRMDHADAPALAVIAKMLKSLFLHREIREKGGAYGGFAVYNPEDGVFGFGSYRDPHIIATLDVYDRAVDFIRSGEIAETDIKEAVLQVCSDIDKPDPPGPAARKAFYRRILKLSDNLRQGFKSGLLQLDRDAVLAAAGRHFDLDPAQQSVVVISGEAQLADANRRLGSQALAVRSI